MMDHENHADNFFGSDGFGDVPDPHAPSLDLVQQKKAKQAIVDLVNMNDGEVSDAPLNFLREWKLRASFSCDMGTLNTL